MAACLGDAYFIFVCATFKLSQYLIHVPLVRNLVIYFLSPPHHADTCYGRTDGRTVALLYPFATSLARGEGIIKTKHYTIYIWAIITLPSVRPSFRNIPVNTLESTSLNGFWPNLVQRIWNPIDFQGHRSKVNVTESNFYPVASLWTQAWHIPSPKNLTFDLENQKGSRFS
jgi:hypothetical protein